MEIHLGISVILPAARGEIAVYLCLADKIDKGCCFMILNFCRSLKISFYSKCLSAKFCILLCFVLLIIVVLFLQVKPIFFSECIYISIYLLPVENLKEMFAFWISPSQA